MAETCGYCEEEFGERPRIQLHCHHIFHTDCVLNRLHLDDDLRCSHCQEFIYPNEANEDNQSVDSNYSNVSGAAANRVLHLYNTNRVFRRDIKTYVHAVSSMSKPKRDLQKIISLKKAELAQPYALIKAQYEGLYNTKKDEIIQSEPYKAYRKADTKERRLYTNLQTKYRVNKQHFPTLQTIPGLKRLHSVNRWRWRYYNRPSSLIRRALRLRLPWW
jgi:hypothetical protein